MGDLHGIFDLPNAMYGTLLPYGGYCSNRSVGESDNGYANIARSNGAKVFKKKKKHGIISDKSRKINRRRKK